MKRACTIFAITVLAAAVSVPLLAGEETEHGMPPEAIKAMTPGEHHQHIAMLVGEYVLKGKSWMEPGAEVMEFGGTRTAKMIFDGRYLEERVESEFMGMPFHGRGLLAYDNLTERYIYTWIDNMATSVTTAYGSCSKDGWMLEGEHKDPKTGEMSKFKNVWKRNDDGSIVFEWHEGGFQMMEITYVPKSKS